MISPLLWGLLVIALIVYCVISIVPHVKRHIQALKFPGPAKLHPIFGHSLDMTLNEEGVFKDLRRWAKICPNGYLLCIVYPYYCINFIKAEDVEILISSSKHSVKSDIYNILHRWLGTGLLTSAGEYWQTNRKLLTPAFHFNILQQFVKVFHNETVRLVEELNSIADKSDIDMVPILSLFTLYTINETSMGTKLDLNDKADKEYEQSIWDISKILVNRILRPWLYWDKMYYNVTSMGLKERKLINILHNFTNTVILNRKRELSEGNQQNSTKKRRMAMLDLLLTAEREGEIDLNGIRDEINTFMFEGHDTTAMSLCFSLMLFAVHNDVQNRIVEEINEVFSDPNEEPSIQKLSELKYLERCIKESLRLYPSVSFISRVADEDIITSQNYFVPSGSTVNIHIYDLHRDPEIFPDPERFDPDRFLPENTVDRHPFAYIPFSAGPRNCIGQKFAMLEMKTVLCGILRKYIVEPVSTPETLRLCAEMVMRSKNGVHVKLVKRNI